MNDSGPSPLHELQARRAERGRDFVCVVTDPLHHGGSLGLAYVLSHDFDESYLSGENVLSDVSHLADRYETIETGKSILVDDAVFYESPFQCAGRVADALRSLRTAPEERAVNVVVVAPHVGVFRDDALHGTDSWCRVFSRDSADTVHATAHRVCWAGEGRWEAPHIGDLRVDLGEAPDTLQAMYEAGAERKRDRMLGGVDTA